MHAHSKEINQGESFHERSAMTGSSCPEDKEEDFSPVSALSSVVMGRFLELIVGK
jgi:hypothetical protein